MEYWLGWFHEGNGQERAIARAAEEMGFAGVALPDHVAIPQGYRSVHPSGENHIRVDTRFPDALITAATMAAVTTRLRFMTYVYVLPMREPFSVASQVATLAMQSGYRFALGVGAGWNLEEMELLGHDPRTRGKRMDEMIAVMRDFWDDGMASLDGEFYRFGLAGQFPVPERQIPVWVGGKSDAALRRAVANDGWLGMNYPMAEIRELLRRLDTEEKRAQERFGERAEPFRRFVIPLAEPTPVIYGQLERWGVDGTVALCWPVEDPAFAGLDEKLEAMQRFADIYLK